ncbi:MAG: CoA transferase, partial [Alphaproteobacteria bacterium]
SGKPPTVPLNLVGDFGGGAMFLAFGVVSALLEARGSGKGQVVDAAMVDGSLSLMAAVFGNWQAGHWDDRRRANLLDGGAHFYTTYETADGRAVAVGAIEARFYQALLKGLGLDAGALPPQHDRAMWPALRARIAQIFLGHTRDHWCAVFEGTEACVTPVLSLTELQGHPHLAERGSFVEIDGVVHPAPAPRFSRTPAQLPSAAPERGAFGTQVLNEWGVI